MFGLSFNGVHQNARQAIGKRRLSHRTLHLLSNVLSLRGLNVSRKLTSLVSAVGNRSCCRQQKQVTSISADIQAPSIGAAAAKWRELWGRLAERARPPATAAHPSCIRLQRLRLHTAHSDDECRHSADATATLIDQIDVACNCHHFEVKLLFKQHRYRLFHATIAVYRILKSLCSWSCNKYAFCVIHKNTRACLIMPF